MLRTTARAEAAIDIVRIESWNELVERADELDDWAFRGHRSAEQPLLSSLTRRLMQYCPDATQWRSREARALRIFRRKAHIYLGDRSALDDELRCLAMMRHHGAPTRLLDFTKSPFVAAFFALEGALGDAAIYALNTPALWNATPIFDPSLTREVIDPRRPDNFARYFAPNDRALLWCGEPAEMDMRLVAQSGLFVVPGQIDLTLEQIVLHYESAQPLMEENHRAAPAARARDARALPHEHHARHVVSRSRRPRALHRLRARGHLGRHSRGRRVAGASAGRRSALIPLH